MLQYLLIELSLTFVVGSLGRQLRCMSALVNVEKQGNIAILELNREPVNSFSLDFLQEINAELDKVEVDQDCKGLIVTSVISWSVIRPQCYM